MSESEQDLNELEAFKESFDNGFDDLLEWAEFDTEDIHAIDPNTMNIDQRTFEELSTLEKAAARQIIYQKLNLDPGKLDGAKVREYITRVEQGEGVVSPGEIKVGVYKTNRIEQGIYLQELTFQDGEKRWVVGPDKNI